MRHAGCSMPRLARLVELFGRRHLVLESQKYVGALDLAGIAGVCGHRVDPCDLEAELFEFGGEFDAGSIAQGGIQPCALGAELLMLGVSPSVVASCASGGVTMHPSAVDRG